MDISPRAILGSSPPRLEDLRPSHGEVHFLWFFIQGSIMVPDTRARLRRAWGMCQRHSFTFLAVDAAFRHGYLHGPALLYEDLMGRALAAFNLHGPLQEIRVAYRLRNTGPCLMCELGYSSTSHGMASREMFEQGRDLTEIRAFAETTSFYWRKIVCGRCAQDETRPRCRVHLREELTLGKAKLREHRTLVQYITEHMGRYARSFRWECRGTDTMEDRAALIGAVGWCSGWQPWLSLIG
jgi:hypothetical protein